MEFALVPVEPTDEMAESIAGVLVDTMASEIAADYRTMIAAAPGGGRVTQEQRTVAIEAATQAIFDGGDGGASDREVKSMFAAACQDLATVAVDAALASLGLEVEPPAVS